MNKTAKNSIIYLLGSIVLGVLGFANTMILTHLCSEKTYAMYGLLVSFASASVVFIAFGYDSAYTRFYYKHGHTQKSFLSMSLKFPLIIFGIFTLILIEPNHFLIKKVFGEDLSFIAIFFLLIYIITECLHRFSQLTARMEEHAANYIISNLFAKSGFIVILAVVLIVSNTITFNWILISFCISCIIAVLINLLVIVKVADRKVESNTPVTNTDLIKYGFPYMIDYILIIIIPLIEKIIIRDLTSWETLGIFTAASIFQSVVLIVSNTLVNIWNPLVFKHCDDEKILKPLIHSFGLGATVIVSLGLSACILLRRWIVLLLGKVYFDVYIIAPAVIFGALFHILNIIYSVGINIKKKTVHLIISSIIQAVVSIFLCYLLIPNLGLCGIAIASLASLIISKTYRILIGLSLYSSANPEWKAGFICIICTGACVFSLFSTSLKSDIILSGLVLLTTALIIGKEVKGLVKIFASYIKPAK